MGGARNTWPGNALKGAAHKTKPFVPVVGAFEAPRPMAERPISPRQMGKRDKRSDRG
jgi:hypothetical protein